MNGLEVVSPGAARSKYGQDYTYIMEKLNGSKKNNKRGKVLTD